MDPIKNPFSPGAGSPPPELVGREPCSTAGTNTSWSSEAEKARKELTADRTSRGWQDCTAQRDRAYGKNRRLSHRLNRGTRGQATWRSDRSTLAFTALRSRSYGRNERQGETRTGSAPELHWSTQGHSGRYDIRSGHRPRKRNCRQRRLGN